MFHVSADSMVTRPFVIVQQSAQSRASRYVASHIAGWRSRNQLVVETLVIPFAMVVRDKFRDRAPEMTLPHRNHPVEAFLFDRSDEPLRVRIRVRSACWRQDHADASLAKLLSHHAAPFSIPVADERAVADQYAVISRRHETHHLAHEELSRYGVEPSTWTRREARSMTHTV